MVLQIYNRILTLYSAVTFGYMSLVNHLAVHVVDTWSRVALAKKKQRKKIFFFFQKKRRKLVNKILKHFEL